MDIVWSNGKLLLHIQQRFVSLHVPSVIKIVFLTCLSAYDFSPNSAT